MIVPSSIIKRVLVTEKAVDASTNHNKYTLEVVPEANKVSIRQAVEAAFKDVKVSSVNVIRTPETRKRIFTRRGGSTLRPGIKKAIVTLSKGKIEMN